MDEVKKIYQAVDGFASAIKGRMVQKYKDEGYQGWDGEYPPDFLCQEIANDAVAIEVNSAHNKATIDIGARAMMLWYRDKAKPAIEQTENVELQDKINQVETENGILRYEAAKKWEVINSLISEICRLKTEKWKAIKELKEKNIELREALSTAIDRMEDMLEDDDGQAYKEAQKVLPELRKKI